MTAVDLRTPTTGREAARFLGAYAKNFAAGAFAVPTAAEIDNHMAHGTWHWWGQGAAAVSRRLTRSSTRLDFSGRAYVLGDGARVITHLACLPSVTLPSLAAFDYVFAYAEDTHITRQLRLQNREIAAVRVSAASEIVNCWGRAGSGHSYPAADSATLVRVPLAVTATQRAAIVAEATNIRGWTDDYPYYSDGSWGAVSLRGFNPADPAWGIKPAEMSKAWWTAHPEAVQYTRCAWTVLAAKCPATVELVRGVEWWGQLERVRLLRMAGRGGKGGSLSRHTDITDRAAGTRDRQIVRFHIPLVTHPDITMSAWNLRGERYNAHLPAWSMWYLDARKPHAVDNRSGVDRVHLVVDVLADAHVRQAIIDGRDVAA
jgi:hypothetical protein